MTPKILLPRRNLILPSRYKQRGVLDLTALCGFGVRPEGGSSATYSWKSANIDSTDQATGNYTWSAVDIGTAAADRRVHVAIHYGSSGTTLGITSVTIGGVAATMNVEQYGASTGVGIYTANVTTGTTGDIVVNWSGATISAAYSAWVSYGLTSDAAYATANNTSNTATIATVNGGFCIAADSRLETGSASSTWTGGVTERYDGMADTTSKLYTGADGSTSGSDITPVCTTTAGSGQRFVCASFG